MLLLLFSLIQARKTPGGITDQQFQEMATHLAHKPNTAHAYYDVVAMAEKSVEVSDRILSAYNSAQGLNCKVIDQILIMCFQALHQ